MYHSIRKSEIKLDSGRMFLNPGSLVDISLGDDNKNIQLMGFFCFQTLTLLFFNVYLVVMLSHQPVVVVVVAVLKNKVSGVRFHEVSLWWFLLKEKWHTTYSFNIFIDHLHLCTWHCSYNGDPIVNWTSKNHCHKGNSYKKCTKENEKEIKSCHYK